MRSMDRYEREEALARRCSVVICIIEGRRRWKRGKRGKREERNQK